LDCNFVRREGKGGRHIVLLRPARTILIPDLYVGLEGCRRNNANGREGWGRGVTSEIAVQGSRRGGTGVLLSFINAGRNKSCPGGAAKNHPFASEVEHGSWTTEDKTIFRSSSRLKRSLGPGKPPLHAKALRDGS